MNATNVTLHPQRHAIWKHIKQQTVGKIQFVFGDILKHAQIVSSQSLEHSNSSQKKNLQKYTFENYSFAEMEYF